MFGANISCGKWMWEEGAGRRGRGGDAGGDAGEEVCLPIINLR